MGLAKPKKLMNASRFRVEVAGMSAIYASKVSGLHIEAEVAESRSGGDLTPDVTLSNLKRPEIVIEQPEQLTSEWLDWLDAALNGAADTGINEPLVRREVGIAQLDLDNRTVLVRYILEEALPYKWEAGERDKKSNEHVMEKVSLTGKRLRRITV